MLSSKRLMLPLQGGSWQMLTTLFPISRPVIHALGEEVADALATE
jgi:hypothetical protein